VSTVDPVQTWREHTVAIVNADAELRTLMGRTVGLIVPWASFKVDGPLPMIAYASISGPRPRSSRAQSFTAGFAVYAATEALANTICARLDAVLRYPAYAARGADIGRDPANPPDRAWPPAEARQDDAAQARADIDLSFLLPG
jgi:hypothetical protein